MTPKHVLQNIKSCIIDPDGTPVSAEGVMECRLTDNTQFQERGSDNDESFRYFRRPYSGNVEIMFEDPVHAQQFVGLTDKSVRIVYADQVGQGDVQADVTHLTTGQVAAPERWNELIGFPLSGRVGAIVFSDVASPSP